MVSITSTTAQSARAIGSGAARRRCQVLAGSVKPVSGEADIALGGRFKGFERTALAAPAQQDLRIGVRGPSAGRFRIILRRN